MATPSIIRDEIVLKRVARCYIEDPNTTYERVAKECALSKDQVKRIVTSTQFRDVCKSIAEDEITPAVTRAKVRAANLEGKAMAVISKVMDMVEDNPSEALKAAAQVLKIIGVDTVEHKQQDASVTVIMPGAQAPQTNDIIVEVNNEVQD